MPRIEQSPTGETAFPRRQASVPSSELPDFLSPGESESPRASLDGDNDRAMTNSSLVAQPGRGVSEESFYSSAGEESASAAKRGQASLAEPFLSDVEEGAQAEPKPEATAPPAKRRRRATMSDGEPRRSSRLSVVAPVKEQVAAVAVAKKGHGRPPKAAKRGRGRPPVAEKKASPAVEQTGPAVVKRGRGRPPAAEKKDSLVVEKTGPAVAEKRGRGRPPKVGKKGRGRPPKTEQAEPGAPGLEWEVEKVVESRIDAVTQEHYYRVKWKGYAAKFNTWEPKKHLSHCRRVIEAFEEETKKG